MLPLQGSPFTRFPLIRVYVLVGRYFIGLPLSKLVLYVISSSYMGPGGQGKAIVIQPLVCGSYYVYREHDITAKQCFVHILTS